MAKRARIGEAKGLHTLSELRQRVAALEHENFTLQSQLLLARSKIKNLEYYAHKPPRVGEERAAKLEHQLKRARATIRNMQREHSRIPMANPVAGEHTLAEPWRTFDDHE